MRIKRKKVKYNFGLLAYKMHVFDNNVVLFNLPQWRTVVSLVKNGAGIVFLNLFIGYVKQF